MAAAVPGYVPAWTVPAGAAELAAAYREHGLTEEAFRTRFTRLAVLQARQGAGELDDAMRVR